MTKHYLLSSLAATLMTLPMLAQSGKQITSITHEDRNEKEESTFTYDASGRIIGAHTVSTSDGDYYPMDFVSTFSYDDAEQTISSHTVISYYGEQIVEDAVGTLSNGRVSKIVIDDLEPGGTVAGTIIEMSYDGDGHVIRIKDVLTTPGEEYLTTENVLLWQDGNLDNVSTTINRKNETSTVVTQIHYDTSKPAPKNPIVAYLLMDLPMDVSSLQALLPMLPYMGFTSRNIATGWDDEEKQVSAAYEYDGDGDITRIEVFSNQERSDTYTFGHAPSGISYVLADQPDDACYSLQGHKVNHPKRGIYVRSGRKVVIR